MAFSSYDFIFLFLPLTLVIYYVLASYRAVKSAITALLFSSLLFYGWWNPYHIWILILSLAVNYAIGAALSKRANRILLIIGITCNVSLIAYYKYKLFIAGIFEQIAGQDWVLGQVILPLGISFFTFQQIAWLVDCSNGGVRNRDPRDYAFFIAFFPQLIAGPIVHHAELVPQARTAPLTAIATRDISIGASIFIIGLAKKIIIADRLAPFASYFFAGTAQGTQYGPVVAWLGTLAYSLQLYFDFSGYSDMAIGIARMFGFKLPLNFNSPYKASSVRDFWRRWHITLSRFLRDYLYLPLGGNRRGPKRRDVNLMITMLLGGLWHGANWTFVVWGGIHGLYLVVNRFWSDWWSQHNARFELPTWFWIAVTFVLVTLAWVPFRADSLTSALSVYAQLFGFRGPAVSQALAEPIIYGVPESIFRSLLHSLGASPLLSGFGCQAAMIAGSLAIAMLMPNTAEMFSKCPSLTHGPTPGGAWSLISIYWRANIFWLLTVAVVFAVCIVFMRRPAPFLYFQF